MSDTTTDSTRLIADVLAEYRGFLLVLQAVSKAGHSALATLPVGSKCGETIVVQSEDEQQVAFDYVDSCSGIYTKFLG